MFEETTKTVTPDPDNPIQHLVTRSQQYWQDYLDTVKAMSNRYFTQHIKPLCDERGWAFVSRIQAKTWQLGAIQEVDLLKQSVDIPEDDTDLVLAIRILSYHVPGLYSYGSMGVFMNDYNPASPSQEGDEDND